MKKISLLCIIFVLSIGSLLAQTPFNPFTQNIHFAPEPTVAGFECGSVQTLVFTQGLTTSADATLWQTDPLTVTICITGFTFNGPASSIVSGTYAGNFNWAFSTSSPNCLIGTQNQTLIGTGTNPIFPNPLSSGNIEISLKVPDNSPVSTVLSVNVTLQVPAYMAAFNSAPDDNESTQTQTFCDCYALTDAGIIGSNQTFCVSGNPSLFTSIASGTGGSGNPIVYQWQELISSVWTDINGATNETYDAPTTSNTKQFRRNAKRSTCGSWLNSNIVTVTVSPNPMADAGIDYNLNCSNPSVMIGTPTVVGNTYSWSPSTGLSSSSIAQPMATPLVNTIYTVTVTNAAGCTATDNVSFTTNFVPPFADAGAPKLLCFGDSITIGSPAILGNTYSWGPSFGLSAYNIAQPIASPPSTTVYTVTVTGSNACTATATVTVVIDVCVIDISGNVYNDTNALTNLNVDGIGFNNPDGVFLYADLIHASGNILASQPIQANGTYLFTNIPTNQTFTMILDTVPGVIGMPAPTPNLPGTWVHTGEDCCDMMGDDGNPDGMNVFTVTNFSKVNIDFGIKDPQATGLPVTIKNFYAMEYKCGGLLSWTTAQEENTSHVDIYRKDSKYTSFHKIATVQCAGSSHEEKAYNYLDKNLSQDGEYQYQLKFVDIDSRFTLSDVKTVKLDCTKEHTGINIFPNPATDKLNILYITETDRVALKLEIVDITGRKIMSKSQFVNGGGTLITFDISSFANGTYFLNYDDIDGRIHGTEKFIKR